jgi:spermidine synthase
MATFVEREDASIRLQDLTVLERHHGRLQTIVLYRHKRLGNVLTINGELQHVEAWQALYHEPLVHVPASFISSLKHVLILGGGDLFAAREALKYDSVRKVTLIEHDRNIVNLTRRFYRHASAVLSDPRLSIIYADARRVFSKGTETYDLIVNDCFDLSLNSTQKGAYDRLAARLTERGVCSDMVYRHIFYRTTVRRSLLKLGNQSHLRLGLLTVPEYPGALHLLTLWGRNSYLAQPEARVRNGEQRKFLSANGCMEFEYYDPKFLEFFLYLPPYVREAVGPLSQRTFV